MHNLSYIPSFLKQWYHKYWYWQFCILLLMQALTCIRLVVEWVVEPRWGRRNTFFWIHRFVDMLYGSILQDSIFQGFNFCLSPEINNEKDLISYSHQLSKPTSNRHIKFLSGSNTLTFPNIWYNKIFLHPIQLKFHN